MQTPSIQANSTVNNNDAAANKSNAKATPEFSFDKILSREISERAPNSGGMANFASLGASAAPKNTSAPAPVANKTESKAADVNRNKSSAPAPTNNNKANPAPPANNNAQASEKTSEVEDTKVESASIAKGEPSPNASSTDDKSAEVSGSQTLLGSAMPADMLALVASFNQPIVKPQNIAQTDQAQALVGKTDTDSAGLAKLEASLTAMVDKAPIGKNSAELNPQDPKTFAAAINQAATAQAGVGEELSKTSSKTDPSLTTNSTTKAEPDLASQIEAGKTPSLKAEAVSTQAAANKAAATPNSSEALPKMSDMLASQAASQVKPEANINVRLPDNLINTNVMAPVAQSNTQFAQIAAVQANEKVAPAVGSDGWDQAVGQKVVWMVAGGQQTAELTLNPPDMGPMKVVLSVSNDQTSISFSAAQPEVRQALESAMPKLREMMAEAGVNLGTSTVSTSLPNPQQQANSGQSNQGGTQQGNTRFGNEDGKLEAAPQIVRTSRINVGLGAVDTFA